MERTDHRSTCRHFFSYRAGVLKVEHHGVGIQRERLLHATRMISGGKTKASAAGTSAVIPHPITGVPILYVNQQHATVEGHWFNGDLVIWDNPKTKC